MVLPKIICANLISKLPASICMRGMASTAQASDPIQKLFLDKIHEYNKKASGTSDGLVDADDSTKRALKEDHERVKRNFGIKDGEEAKITAKFSDDSFKIDPINQKDW